MEGQLVWQTTLVGYRARRWELVSGGRGLQMAADPVTGTAHTGAFLTYIGGDSVVITLHEGSLQDPAGRLETRYLSLANGRETQAAPTSVIIATTHGPFLYAFQNDPFPKLIAFPK